MAAQVDLESGIAAVSSGIDTLLSAILGETRPLRGLLRPCDLSDDDIAQVLGKHQRVACAYLLDSLRVRI